MWPYHPERPARLPAIEDELVACGLMPKLERHVAPLATHEQLLRVHAADYIEMLEVASLVQRPEARHILIPTPR